MPKCLRNSALQNRPGTYSTPNSHRITFLRKATYNSHRITFLAKKPGGVPALQFVIDNDALMFYDCAVVSYH